MNPRKLVTAAAVCLVPAWMAAQPSPTPAAAPASSPPAVSPTPAPNVDLRMIRMKISAGDLPSAESILEYHRTETGEDGDYVLGLAWCARGAALLGDWKAAESWAKGWAAPQTSNFKPACF